MLKKHTRRGGGRKEDRPRGRGTKTNIKPRVGKGKEKENQRVGLILQKGRKKPGEIDGRKLSKRKGEKKKMGTHCFGRKRKKSIGSTRKEEKANPHRGGGKDKILSGEEEGGLAIFSGETESTKKKDGCQRGLF